MLREDYGAIGCSSISLFLQIEVCWREPVIAMMIHMILWISCSSSSHKRSKLMSAHQICNWWLDSVWECWTLSCTEDSVSDVSVKGESRWIPLKDNRTGASRGGLTSQRDRTIWIVKVRCLLRKLWNYPFYWGQKITLFWAANNQSINQRAILAFQNWSSTNNENNYWVITKRIILI